MLWRARGWISTWEALNLDRKSACIGAVGVGQTWIGIGHAIGVRYRRTLGLTVE